MGIVEKKREIEERERDGVVVNEDMEGERQ